MMTEKLGLSPEQQSKIRAIMESSAPELRSLISKGRENLSEDEKKKVMDLMKEQRDQIGDVLTAEQKEKMREMKNGHGPGAKGGPDGGKGRKGGPDEKGDKGGDGKKKHGDKKGAE